MPLHLQNSFQLHRRQALWVSRAFEQRVSSRSSFTAQGEVNFLSSDCCSPRPIHSLPIMKYVSSTCRMSTRGMFQECPYNSLPFWCERILVPVDPSYRSVCSLAPLLYGMYSEQLNFVQSSILLGYNRAAVAPRGKQPDFAPFHFLS